MKKLYTKPAVRLVGDIRSITQGGFAGRDKDQYQLFQITVLS
jgi:hypothetical protein